MCRWLGYSGDPIYIEDLVLRPHHSLIDQSLAALHGDTTTNGDGFGLGWYGSRELPGVYKEIRPAWNDPNLHAIAAQIRSHLFFAHVRAATAGTGVQRSNCHPFQHGRWLFVHNGLIRGWDVLRRELMLAVAPELFGAIQGTTDSEVMFYLALTLGMAEDVHAGVARMVGLVEAVGQAHGIAHPVQMTLGISDGRRLFAFRYSSEGSSRTLFYSGSPAALAEMSPDAPPHSARAIAIVSEPLSELTTQWVEIPEATALVVDRGEVDCRDFKPQS